MSQNLKIVLNGIIKENPSLRLVLGTCPTLAVTTLAVNGLGMGLSATFVLICSGIVVSALRNVIPGNAFVTIGVPADKKEEDLRTRLNHYSATVELEYDGIENAQRMTLETIDAPEKVIDADTAKRVIMWMHSSFHHKSNIPWLHSSTVLNKNGHFKIRIKFMEYSASNIHAGKNSFFFYKEMLLAHFISRDTA